MVKRIVVTAWLVILSLPSLAQGAHEGARDVSLALNVGNDRAIAEMRRQGRLGADVERLVDAASRPDRKAMKDALAGCRASGEAAGDAQDAISCGLLLAGLGAADGDAPSWASAWHWLRTSGMRLLTGGTGKGSLGKGFDDVDFASIEANAPKARFQFTSATGRLALLPADSHDARPHTLVTVGGKQVRALVDTGAAATLIVPRHMASALSLDLIATGLTVIQHALPSLDRSNATEGWDGYALADVTVGNLVAKDVLVLVTDRPLESVVIGNALLSMFGEVRFGGESIVVTQPGAAPGSCPAGVPMRFLPGQQFQGRFTIPAQLNGQNARLGIDSGGGPDLVVVGHAARHFSDAPRRTVDATIGGMPATVEVGSVPLSLSVGTLQGQHVQASVVQGQATNVDAILGAPLLIRNRAVLSFEDGNACL